MNPRLAQLSRRLVARNLPAPEHALWKLLYWRHLKRRLTQWRIDCVVDVGANVGQYARGLREIGYAGWIVSFEPVAEVFDTLVENFADDAKWHGERMALGSRDGKINIHVPLDSSVFSSPLLPQRDWRTRTEEASLRRLDSVMTSMPQAIVDSKRIFLKIDTQGYDLEVFEGAPGLLDRVLGLQSELAVLPMYLDAPEYISTLERYRDAGYVLDGIFETHREGNVGTLVELDAIFRHTQVNSAP